MNRIVNDDERTSHRKEGRIPFNGYMGYWAVNSDMALYLLKLNRMGHVAVPLGPDGFNPETDNCHFLS